MSLVGKEKKQGGKPFQKPYPDEPNGKKEPKVKNPALQAIISEQEHDPHPEADNTQAEAALPMPTDAKDVKDVKEETNVKAGTEEEKPERGTRITAIVPELINEELEAVVDRFKITASDSNLWKLTRAALEAIRPEYSHNPEEYAEKCSRLRQRVILEMTKAAIKLSKENRTPD